MARALFIIVAAGVYGTVLIIRKDKTKGTDDGSATIENCE